MPAGRSRRGTSVSAHTSAACQSLMDQQHDQHARGPPESTCLRSSSLLFALPLSISRLIFFCMNSSLACADILIPPPNPPPTYLSQRTHQKLVQSFPLPLRPCLLPFPLFNNRGHGHNCGGRQRAKRRRTCLRSTNRGHLHVYPPLSGRRDLILSSVIDTLLTQVSRRVRFRQFRVRIFPLRARVAVSTGALGSAGGQTEGGYCAFAARSRGSTLQSLPSHHILKSFSSQVLGSFTNSCCFIRAKLAHCETSSFVD